MTPEKDIRWEQRFSSFNKALKKLTEAVTLLKEDFAEQEIESELENTKNVLEEMVKEGLIQRFEYTFEIAWNLMKDYALFQGNSEIRGSRDAIRYAFASDLITNGDCWMDMIKSRVKTSHIYNEETAQEIYLKIINEYFTTFLDFQKVMESIRSGEQKRLFNQE
ncbi:MAG: nucleotidyltransferase substrate binding protein [Bacteroidales bacterium]|nr:nucleotidyltransferase substrate binding protein [Bacteroidales bacterium]